jgi:organic hydroperoxide reductase OsmC/OhrA
MEGDEQREAYPSGWSEAAPEDKRMARREHTYRVQVEWTGNRGTGTSGYREYGREHTIRAAGKPEIAGSSDAAFRGDAARWNPEDLLVAAAAACHKLWYLHLCADAGIAVQSYVDEAVGVMLESPEQGRFTRIVLRPKVTIRSGDDAELAARLHQQAHAHCYVANSVNFPIDCEPLIETAR